MEVEHLPLFRGVRADHVRWALQYFHEAEVDVGTQLIIEGENDSSLLCVLYGELEISTGGVVLGTAVEADLVGEVALFGGGMRSATVEALTQCNLLVLDRSGYIQLRNLDSPVAQAIEEIALEVLTARLMSTSARISEAASGTPVEHVRPPRSFFGKVADILGLGGAAKGPKNYDVVAALSASDLFRDAPPRAMEELATLFKAQLWSKGSFICIEGDIGSEMFLVAEGEVDVVVTTDEDRVEPLASLTEGEAFGMCSLIAQEPRMASCIARNDCVLLSLQRETWSDLSTEGGLMASVLRTAVIRCLAEQLSYANAQLAQLDISRQNAASEEGLAPLIKASAGFEAYGSHLTE